MKNIFTFLLISGLFSSCLENNPQQKTEITELTNTDTNATEKITKEEKKAWLKSSQVSLYKEDTIIWSDEKAIIFNKEGYKVLFEDEDRTYYEAEGIYEFSIEEIKNYKSSEPERYEKMMNELSRRSNNYTLLFIKGPFIVYKDEYYFDVGAHPVGGEELICYSLLTDSIIKTLDIAYDTDDQYELDYKKALATIENIITEKIFDTSDSGDIVESQESEMIVTIIDFDIDEVSGNSPYIEYTDRNGKTNWMRFELLETGMEEWAEVFFDEELIIKVSSARGVNYDGRAVPDYFEFTWDFRQSVADKIKGKKVVILYTRVETDKHVEGHIDYLHAIKSLK